MNSRLLTHDKLVEFDACEDQRANFRIIFGDQVEVSVERFSQSDVIVTRFDYYWAADALLTREQREQFYDELGKRKSALMEQRGVHWYTDIPRDERHKLLATTWAEFYVKAAPPAEQPPAPEFPRVEESVSGR